MSKDIGTMRRLALSDFERGNYSAAELLCREILHLTGDDAEIETLLEQVIERLSLRPSERAGPERLALTDDGLPLEDSTRHRYLLIKAWGNGFWSDVNHVLGCALLAEITGRIPVTHWGTNSLFTDGSGRDAFQLYFRPLSQTTRDQLASLRAPIFPDKWRRENLHEENLNLWSGRGSRLSGLDLISRTETVVVADFYISVISLLPYLPNSHPMVGKPIDAVYRYLIDKYLRLQPELAAQIGTFVKSVLARRPVVAVHMRGSDKILEQNNLTETNAAYFDVIDMTPKSYALFLITDDQRLADQFALRYGERVILPSAIRSGSNMPIHYCAGHDPVQLAREVVRDAFAAATCDLFIGNGASNVSAMIGVLRDWPSGHCVQIEPPLIYDRPLDLYRHTDSPP